MQTAGYMLGCMLLRPYWVHNRYTKKGMITVFAERFRFRFPILLRACGMV